VPKAARSISESDGQSSCLGARQSSWHRARKQLPRKRARALGLSSAPASDPFRSICLRVYRSGAPNSLQVIRPKPAPRPGSQGNSTAHARPNQEQDHGALSLSMIMCMHEIFLFFMQAIIRTPTPTLTGYRRSGAPARHLPIQRHQDLHCIKPDYIDLNYIKQVVRLHQATSKSSSNSTSPT
jgi:hypothetical protein